MKQVVFRLLCLCLMGTYLSACVPVPTVAPKPNISALDQRVKRVADGDPSAQGDLAQDFSNNRGGLGQDRQTSDRLLYAAADRGDIKAKTQLAAASWMSIANRAPTAPPSSPDDLMEAAYWAYQVAQSGNRVYMERLSLLYARTDFPAYDLVESCKWRLLARLACDPKSYDADVFQEASKRAQPLFSQFPK